MQRLSFISKKKVASKHLIIAKKQLEKANLLLKVYYPSLEDPKLFLQVIQAIHVATIEKMLSLLAKKGKHVKTKNSLKVLQAYQKYCRSIEEVNLLVWATTLIRAHKNSPLCFRKKEMYIICNNSLDMAVITEEKLFYQISMLEEFIKK